MKDVSNLTHPAFSSADEELRPSLFDLLRWLAKLLGVSRGSFYWYFADAEEFERGVLDQWETVAVDTPYAQAKATARRDSTTALQTLIRWVFHSLVGMERPVRSWATTSPIAAIALARVDQRRLSILTELISLTETCPHAARTRAVILYWTSLGRVTTADAVVDEVVVTALIEPFCRI